MARLHLDSPGAFFPPLVDGDETPEFVRWAIEYECGPREQHRGDDLEAVFRQLRPLAALGDAHSEDRLTPNLRAVARDGVIRYEFDAIDILNFYGSANLSEVPCLTCPANGPLDHFPNCFGVISCGPATEAFFNALEAELDIATTLIPSTTPRWYGFWAESPMQDDRLHLSADLLRAALSRLEMKPTGAIALLKAMQTAHKLKLSLHHQLHPPGIVRDGRWEVPAHCGYCGVLRAPRQRVCKICCREKVWKSAEKRRLIGIRPYREVKSDS